MSLDTSLDETNYDAFDPPIPEECLESNIDKTPYKWTASTVSSGRCNAANIMPLRPRPQKSAQQKRAHWHMDKLFYRWYDYNGFE